MYTDDDLASAVQAGALDQDSVNRFQKHVAQSRNIVIADEERFRLVSSFNDIFVLIASLMLMLGAAVVIGKTWGAVLCAVLAWALAEIFTRYKRMASPSIIYALVFTIAPAIALMNANEWGDTFKNTVYVHWLWAGAATLAAVCATCFWKRFQVPVALSLLCAALVACMHFVLIAFLGSSKALSAVYFFLAGLLVFFLAMRFDTKDLKRVTAFADIAFWLHLLAASLTVHTLFQFMEIAGLQKGNSLAALLVIAVFLGLMVLALVIDRRATLVSAAIYVIAVLAAGLQRLSSFQDSAALVMLVVGGFLLMLSWGWNPIRKRLLALLPSAVTSHVPAAH